TASIACDSAHGSRARAYQQSAGTVEPANHNCGNKPPPRRHAEPCSGGLEPEKRRYQQFLSAEGRSASTLQDAAQRRCSGSRSATLLPDDERFLYPAYQESSGPRRWSDRGLERIANRKL